MQCINIQIMGKTDTENYLILTVLTAHGHIFFKIYECSFIVKQLIQGIEI